MTAGFGGKVAIVPGGAGGIGLATARALQRRARQPR
jgi:NAD(P)-dependent dehydrogenase (short-subunit alcohol dehydrogenase family)